MLKAGANPHVGNTYEKCVYPFGKRLLVSNLYSTPYQFAWRIIYSSSHDERTLERLRCLFPMDEHSEDERKFSRLHRIILGVSNYRLENEIAEPSFDPNVTDSGNMTALSWAVQRGTHNAINLLLQAEADPNISNIQGNSPLIFAARKYDATSIKLLLDAGANSLCINKFNQNPLHYMSYTGTIATSQAQYETVQSLVAAGANTNLKDSSTGSTPLMRAACNDKIVIAKALLDHGAAIDMLDFDGDSALGDAMVYGSFDTAKLLLERGADFTVVNDTGNTILHLATYSKNLDTLKVLIEASMAGINPNAVNDDGKTAMQLVEEHEPNPDGFMEMFHALLFGISNRNDHARRNEESIRSVDGEALISVPGAWPHGAN